MDYPFHLLPQRNYKIIPYEAWMNAYHLLHHTRDKDLLDPETNLLKLDYIVINTDHLKDFSTNLLGIFTPKDCYWSIKKQRSDEYFGKSWEEGEEVASPLFDDFEYHDERGLFYLKIENFARKEVRSRSEDEITVICDVLHTPVRFNFWHFSLRWRNETGEHIHELKANRIRNFFKSVIRKFIQDNAVLETPDFYNIPPDKYQKIVSS